MNQATTDRKIITAKLGFVRQTPRKLRRTANLVRNKAAGEAVTQLGFMPYAAAEPIRKLIVSAIANASHNNQVENPSELIVSELLVDDGVIYKRWRAANKGRAHGIKKRCSKIKLVLSDMNAAEYAKHVWAVSPRNRVNQVKKAKTEVQDQVKATKKSKKTEANSEVESKPIKKKATSAKKKATKNTKQEGQD